MANHSQVAHRWAQDDASARTVKGFNMFYERRPAGSPLFAPGSDVATIFSHGHHFPIATFVTTPAGQRVCLFTLRDYSISTSAHKHEVSRALRGSVPTFAVEHVDPMHKPGGAEGFHEANLADLLERAAKAYQTSTRARTQGAWHLDNAERYVRTAERYSEAFGLAFDRPELVDLAAAIAERQRAEAVALAEQRRVDAARRVAVMAEARARDRDQFEAWQAGNSNHCPASFRTDESGGVYMRRHQAWRSAHQYTVSEPPTGQTEDLVRSDTLQTSMGAEVPWRDAVKVFHFVHSRRSAGAAWRRREGDAAPRAGAFTVDEVMPDGSFRAGCHQFAWSEIERLAKREGVL